MSEITELNKHSQGTTRDKYKTVARAQKMKHDDLMDHVTSHMLSCCDDDCDICDLGQSGSMIDNDDEGNGPEHTYGTRSSKGREGADNIDSVGKKAQSDSKSDKQNLMRHGEHITKRDKRKAVAGPSTLKAASAILKLRK